MVKKLLVILTVVTLSLSACSALPSGLNVIKGSGNVTSEPRDISGVTGIDVAGSQAVDISFGETESLVIEAEDNIIPLIETKVQNGRLVIGSKSGAGYSSTKPVNVHVTLKSLDSVSLSGSGSISVPDFQGDTLNVDLDGSGDINISGTVDTADMTVGGSGRVNGEQLKANSVKVVVDGSGNASVYASDQLDATVEGSGSIQYSGNPADINQNVNGSGSITAE